MYCRRKKFDVTVDYLLMSILDEPDAHEIPEMKTEDNRKFWSQSGPSAGSFIQTGKSLW